MIEFTIPEGTRDLILGECSLKRELEIDIGKVLDKWGYTEVVTPTIEYYETYSKSFGKSQDNKMYRFFNVDRKIVTLRMDMTVPIARVVATKFKNQKGPFRFRYCANVFKVEDSLGGMKSELTDCGVELIGLDSEESDLEILCCAMEVLKKLNTKSYTLEIGNINLFKVACTKMSLLEEQQEKLAELIDNKQLKELKDYILTLGLEEVHKKFLLEIPMMCGSKKILHDVKNICFHRDLIEIVKSLECMSEDLEALGYAGEVSFDFGKVPRLNYYTGLIFEAFIENVGVAVLSGGRYDKLIGEFGKNMPAVGFSVKLDHLLNVIEKDHKKHVYVIRYPINKRVDAILKAKELREDSIVELLPYEGEDIQIKKERR